MVTLPRTGTFSAFAMIVDINGFGKLAFSDFQGIAQFTGDLLIGGIYRVEKNGGQVVGFMGDAFYAILHDVDSVFNCCSEIAKDMAGLYDDFASSQNTFPFSPKNIGLKIGVEYGLLDTGHIYSRFLDETIIFRPLTKDNLYSIIDIEMKKMSKRLAEQGIRLELSLEARDFLIEKGYNPDFGARPLRRAIEQSVEDQLSESILRGDFKGVDLVKIHRDGEKLRFESVNTKGEQPTETAAAAPADAT